jgi:hypothetical protein
MLFLVFLMLTLGLFALFLGGGIVAQGYLYQNPAERMPLRAAGAAVLVAGFITLWVSIDRRSPGKYDTLFNFVGYSTAEFNEFEAVRWTANPDGSLKRDAGGKQVETTAKFRRAAGGKDAKFLEEGTELPFQMSGNTGTGQYMTGAIRVKGPNDPEPVRYNATVKEEPNSKRTVFAPETRFNEEKGSRYVEAHKIGTLFLPSSGTVAGALALNFLLFVVWLVAFWLLLRFSFSHAIIFTGVFGVLTMMGAMPLLFARVREAKPAPAPAPAALVVRDRPTSA